MPITKITILAALIALMSFALAGCGENSNAQSKTGDADAAKGDAVKDADDYKPLKLEEGYEEVVEHFENGKVKVSYAVRKGAKDAKGQPLRHGPYIEFHDNGRKAKVGQFVEGKAEGVFEMWRNKGYKEGFQTYKNDLKCGRWEEYHESGELKKEGEYNEKGNRHGTWRRWYRGGKKWSEFIYVDGKQEGPAVSWSENGQKSQEINYKGGNPVGAHTEWHDNGKISRQGQYGEKGKRTGVWTFWHKNGQKESECVYDAQGEQTGPGTEWYDNGKMKTQGQFVQGRKEGEWTEWDAEGKLTGKTIYENDQPVVPDAPKPPPESGK